MTVAWVALAIATATTIFWVGVYFGSLRGHIARMRQRIRDLEQAMATSKKRPFVSRFPQDRTP